MAGEPVLVSANAKSFQVYTNPSLSDLSEIGPSVRFTANRQDRNVYVWDFNSGWHSDVSIGLQLNDSFNSLDFLKGHAGKNDDGYYEMVGSDFLTSFVGKLAGKEKIFFRSLLNQDWDWVDDYIKVTVWIGSFKEKLGI